MSNDALESTKHTANYTSSEIKLHEIEDASIAVRVFGSGPALVFIHGYPVNGYTWRKLLPKLSTRFTCYVIDLPGLGDSLWTEGTNFSFTAQARRLDGLIRKLNLTNFAIVAHDTGATIARLVAISQAENVSKLAIINTEIPGHRPPWVQFYQHMAKLPLAQGMFRLCMKSKLFLRSTMGLGQFYSNRELFNDPASLGPYISPLVNEPQRLKGALNYLKGIEWDVVDQLEVQHKDIAAEVLFIWGENDKTFPVHLAEKMCIQFRRAPGFVRISSASLMPHEEKPYEMLIHLIPFLANKMKHDKVTERENETLVNVSGFV